VIGRLFLALALVAIQVVSSQITFAQGSPRADARPAWLGVALVQAMGGVRIEEVIRDSPADVSGIRAGDIVVAVAGKSTPTPQSLTAAVLEHAVGEEISVRLSRAGKIMQFEAHLTERLDPGELLRRRLVDLQAPEFFLRVLHGKASGELKQERGKVVVLAFLTGWCKVCKESIEPLANLQADAPGELVVLGITSELEAQATRFLASNSLPFSLLLDPQTSVHQAYRYDSNVPTMVVIGRDGLVRYADTGDDLDMDAIAMHAKRAVRESTR
tara:strand:+ start:121733 stop:122545 length:813 start_codon:yes stop_codon:yes gene_type:complete